MGKRLFLAVYSDFVPSYADYKSCMQRSVYYIMHFRSRQCCGGYYSALTESNLPPLLLTSSIWLAYKPHCSERKSDSSADWPEPATVSGFRCWVSVCKGLFVPFSGVLADNLPVKENIWSSYRWSQWVCRGAWESLSMNVAWKSLDFSELRAKL